jgi:hypothetical protein
MGFFSTLPGVENALKLLKEGATTLAQFIDIAEAQGMPVKVLRRVKEGYSLKPWADSDGSRMTLNRLDLTESTMSGLRQSPISTSSVGTLYHEATHAFLDLTDDDETSMFENVMSVYKDALLFDGTHVSDPERVAHEAAAEYVGTRAALTWQAMIMMAAAEGILDDVDSGKSTAADAVGDIGRMAPIPLTYNDQMQQRVFGYEEKSGSQVSVALQPIPEQLKDYCDNVILEGKIKDDFALMKQFHVQHDRLQTRYQRLLTQLRRFPFTPRPGGV